MVISWLMIGMSDVWWLIDDWCWSIGNWWLMIEDWGLWWLMIVVIIDCEDWWLWWLLFVDCDDWWWLWWFMIMIVMINDDYWWWLWWLMRIVTVLHLNLVSKGLTSLLRLATLAASRLPKLHPFRMREDFKSSLILKPSAYLGKRIRGETKEKL